MPQLAPAPMVKACPLPLLRTAEIAHPERAAARGDIVRVRAGVYAPGEEWNALAPWDRYLARVHAVARVHPQSVFCFESAAVLLGAPIFGDPVAVHVLVEHAGASRLTAGVRSHRGGHDRTIIGMSGLAVTSPADTAIDLARHRHPAVGLTATDAALRLHPALTREMLVALNESRNSSRGRKIARWSVSRSTASAETALESVSRAAIEWLGLPDPELQVTFRARSGVKDRTDMFWPGARVVGESDGDLKYDGRFGDAVDSLRRQRERDARLREQPGVRSIAHWGWADVASVTSLRDILVGTGLRPIAPEHSAPLFSLRRALASPRERSSAREQWADER